MASTTPEATVSATSSMSRNVRSCADVLASVFCMIAAGLPPARRAGIVMPVCAFFRCAVGILTGLGHESLQKRSAPSGESPAESGSRRVSLARNLIGGFPRPPFVDSERHDSTVAFGLARVVTADAHLCSGKRENLPIPASAWVHFWLACRQRWGAGPRIPRPRADTPVMLQVGARARPPRPM